MIICSTTEQNTTPHIELFMLDVPDAETSLTWMTRTSVSGYFLNTDSKANAGKRKMVERVAARARTVLYGAG